ncbi:MAG: alkaline phosphatase family protein, partial [Acidobacteriota bacterium]
VIVAGGGAAETAESDRRPASASSVAWRASAIAGILAFAGAASLLVVTAPRDRRDETGAPLSVVSSGLRVRLIAIDGFDPDVFAELANAGRLPALARAFSSSRARLEHGDHDGSAGERRDPARVWTTVATGQPPDVHGVRGLETRRIAGLQGIVPTREPSRLGAAIRTATDLLRLSRPAIASGSERREKTMWEVAADAGLRTAVVNWWATWPAAETGGVVLSDRAALRLDIGGALDAEIAPADLYERLHARWPSIREAAARRAAAAWAGLPEADEEVHPILSRSAELDAIQLTLAREVSTPEPDLAAVYLAGLDIAQHALLGQTDSGAAPGASRVAARLQALRDYYVFLDRLLTDTLQPSADDLVIVVTEPGRVGANADGLMGIAGRAARSGADVSGRITDVMPTVLHALGVPISRDLAGAPLNGLFSADFTRRYPVRQVASYGRPAAKSADRKGQPLDQEMIDRLRSLGYVR